MGSPCVRVVRSRDPSRHRDAGWSRLPPHVLAAEARDTKMSPPTWLGPDGHRLPTRPCPQCGKAVPVRHFAASTLRQLGWRPYGKASWVNWCGHPVEVILLPDADGSYRTIPIIGEAS